MTWEEEVEYFKKLSKQKNCLDCDRPVDIEDSDICKTCKQVNDKIEELNNGIMTF